MALPDFSMRQLLEAGVHFGHQKHRWNPKMERYIFGVRNDIHILDLSQTVPALSRALQLVSDTVADGGRVLFVGTKRQAAPLVADAAKQCAQYYVNSRWLGGTLTNWQTISNSISMWLADGRHFPIPLYLHGLLERSIDPSIAAISTLVILFALLLVVLIEKVFGISVARLAT